jgi:hypothetical protein
MPASKIQEAGRIESYLTKQFEEAKVADAKIEDDLYQEVCDVFFQCIAALGSRLLPC